MRTALVAIATFATFVWAGHVAAHSAALPKGFHWGRCILEVDGKRYIAGRCSYVIQTGGSFTIEGPKQDYAALASDRPFAELVSTDYFAQVDVAGDHGDGYWNEDMRALHAQTPLGTLRRKGACWINAKARICLWKS